MIHTGAGPLGQVQCHPAVSQLCQIVSVTLSRILYFKDSKGTNLWNACEATPRETKWEEGSFNLFSNSQLNSEFS